MLGKLAVSILSMQSAPPADVSPSPFPALTDNGVSLRADIDARGVSPSPLPALADDRASLHADNDTRRCITSRVDVVPGVIP